MLKPSLSEINDASLEVHFINVGHGDAIAIKFPNNETMLIDGGYEEENKNLFNYLNKVFFRNIEKEFTYVVATHSDADHIGNTLKVLENYNVKNFLRPRIYAKYAEPNYGYGYLDDSKVYETLIKKVIELEQQNKINNVFLNSNNKFVLGENCILKCLSPIAETNLANNENDFSAVLRLECGNFSFMFMADVSSEMENFLRVQTNENLKCDVLKVAHHGSKNSTNAEFLNATMPQNIVVSSGDGVNNLPNPETIKRIREYCNNNLLNFNETYKNTNNNGNIIFAVKNENLNYKNIKNVNNYVFVNWWVVVLIINFVLLSVLIFNFNKLAKINANMFNEN